jgi:DNA-binding NtrC family response regulator
MNPIKVLVINSDGGIRALLGQMLTGLGYAVVSAAQGHEAIEKIAATEIPLVLLDPQLTGPMSGPETLRALRAVDPPPEVVVTTAKGAVISATDAARSGAFDFVSEPFNFKELGQILRTAYKERLRRRQGQKLQAALGAHDPFPEIVGKGLGIKRVLAVIHKAGPTSSPVLIQGESGTGKELVARALHRLSPRGTYPLTVVDCGALQDTLLESELFVHERGAFTGAHALKHGLFETADNGTLFLDEIGEMSPATQVKVLRALQSGEFRRIGSNRPIRTDVRIIAATNKDLREEVKRGTFREDLDYRIAVIEISVPPLRERKEDIPLLIEHFLSANHHGEGQRLRIAKEALNCLVGYPWPGNIRELKNTLERLSVLAEGDVITIDNLPRGIVNFSQPETPADLPKDLPLHEVERLYILRTLKHYRGNKKKAAQVLGIDTKTLYNKLRRYGVFTPGAKA